mgnify:CR=1 FL=1
MPKAAKYYVCFAQTAALRREGLAPSERRHVEEVDLEEAAACVEGEGKRLVETETAETGPWHEVRGTTILLKDAVARSDESVLASRDEACAVLRKRNHHSDQLRFE